MSQAGLTAGFSLKPGSKGFLALAVSAGAGTVLGIIGTFLYYKFHKRLCNCDSLRNDLMVMKNELGRLQEYVQRINGSNHHSNRQRAKSVISDDIFFDATDRSRETSDDESSPRVGPSGSKSSRTQSKHSVDSSSTKNTPVSSPFETFLHEIDQLVADGTDEKRARAYQLMHENFELGKNDADFMWRFSMTAYLYAQTFLNKDEKKRKSLFFEAKDHAFGALAINDTNGSVHKWCALTVGVLADFVSIREKIDYGHKFKVHIDRALELMPTDAVLHHLCGRWCFSVAALSWIERKLVSALFSNPPSSTYADALREFLEADNLKPNWLENILYMVKCYYAIKDYDSCRQRIIKSHHIKAVSSDDFASKKAMQTIFEKL